MCLFSLKARVSHDCGCVHNFLLRSFKIALKQKHNSFLCSLSICVEMSVGISVGVAVAMFMIFCAGMFVFAIAVSLAV